jgi:hypothetical protein
VVDFPALNAALHHPIQDAPKTQKLIKTQLMEHFRFCVLAFSSSRLAEHVRESVVSTTWKAVETRGKTVSEQ